MTAREHLEFFCRFKKNATYDEVKLEVQERLEVSQMDILFTYYLLVIVLFFYCYHFIYIIYLFMNNWIFKVALCVKKETKPKKGIFRHPFS